MLTKVWNRKLLSVAALNKHITTVEGEVGRVPVQLVRVVEVHATLISQFASR